VQQGVIEIEEILNQVEMYRRNWLNAEKAKRHYEAEERRISSASDSVNTPEIQSKLRTLTERSSAKRKQTHGRR